MSIHYDYDKLLSREFLIAFVITERGLGKTFGAKVAMIKHFLRTGEQFVYVRRYKTELDTSLVTFWNDIQNNGFFDDLSLKVKRSKLLTEFTCDNEVCGYAVPLSTSNILKSTAFPKVKYIIFDEYLLWPGSPYHYLKNEVTMLLELMETVFRLRDGKVIMLGNAINVYTSPYFAYWDLDIDFDKEFKSYQNGSILVQYAKNDEYRKVKKASKFGKLIEGTDYGRYAIDNQDITMNNYFISKKPSNSNFMCLLIINGTKIGMWISKDGDIYLSSKYDPNTTNKFAFDYTDHTDSTIFTTIRYNYYMQACIKAFTHGWLKFENQKIKAIAVSALNRCMRV